MCTKPQQKSATSEIVKPTIGNIIVKVLATGTVSPYRRIEIKSSDRGRIE